MAEHGVAFPATQRFVSKAPNTVDTSLVRGQYYLKLIKEINDRSYRFEAVGRIYGIDDTNRDSGLSSQRTNGENILVQVTVNARSITVSVS